MRIAAVKGVEGYVIVDNTVGGGGGRWPAGAAAAAAFNGIAGRSTTPSDVAPPTGWLQGTILRQSKSLSAPDAAVYASEMTKLAQKARHVVRDLDPKVSGGRSMMMARCHRALSPLLPRGACARASSCAPASISRQSATVFVSVHHPPLQVHRHLQNDLEIFRLRAQEHEILVAPGPAGAFTVIVIQRWTPSAGADDLAAAMMMMSGGAGGPVAAGSGAAAAAAVAAASAAGAPPGTASGAR